MCRKGNRKQSLSKTHKLFERASPHFEVYSLSTLDSRQFSRGCGNCPTKNSRSPQRKIKKMNQPFKHWGFSAADQTPQLQWRPKRAILALSPAGTQLEPSIGRSSSILQIREIHCGVQSLCGGQKRNEPKEEPKRFFRRCSCWAKLTTKF